MDRNHLLILYVEDTPASVRFYERLLGRPPLESSENFAMFGLREGLALGLWRRSVVRPKAEGRPSASELCIDLPSDAEVDAFHARWRDLGIAVAQPPTAMEFGYNAVALDPDGHRLRALHAAG